MSASSAVGSGNRERAPNFLRLPRNRHSQCSGKIVLKTPKYRDFHKFDEPRCPLTPLTLNGAFCEEIQRLEHQEPAQTENCILEVRQGCCVILVHENRGVAVLAYTIEEDARRSLRHYRSQYCGRSNYLVFESDYMKKLILVFPSVKKRVLVLPYMRHLIFHRHISGYIVDIVLHSRIDFIFNIRVPAAFISHPTAPYSEVLIPSRRRSFRVNFRSAYWKILGHSHTAFWLIIRRGVQVLFSNGLEYISLPDLPANDAFPNCIPEFGRVTGNPRHEGTVTMIVAFLADSLVLNRYRYGEGGWMRRTIATNVPQDPRGVVLFDEDFIWFNARNGLIYRIIDWARNPNARIARYQIIVGGVMNHELFSAALGQTGFNDLYCVFIRPNSVIQVSRMIFHGNDQLELRRLTTSESNQGTADEIDLHGLTMFVSSSGQGFMMPSPAGGMQNKVYYAGHRSDVGWLNDPIRWNVYRQCQHRQTNVCNGCSFWFILDFVTLYRLELMRSIR